MKQILNVVFLLIMSSYCKTVSAQLATNLAIDPRAMSMGNAVTADPPGIASIHFNPAGLSRLEGRQLELQFLGASVGLESEFSAPADYGVFGFSMAYYSLKWLTKAW